MKTLLLLNYQMYFRWEDPVWKLFSSQFVKDWEERVPHSLVPNPYQLKMVLTKPGFGKGTFWLQVSGSQGSAAVHGGDI